jgi:hypothetical protein
VEFEDEDYVPSGAVHDPLVNLSDRQILQAELQALSSHADIPEWLISRTYFAMIPGYSPLGDVNFLVSSRLAAPCRKTMGVIRVGYLEAYANRLSWHETCSVKELTPIFCEKMSSTGTNVQWLPWVILTEAQLSELRDLFESPNPLTWYKFDKGIPGLRYYESATSHAIQFLSIFNASYLLKLRPVVIHEDRKSAAMPKFHAHGLIEHLQRLPNLRIEHRMDMWNTM